MKWHWTDYLASCIVLIVIAGCIIMGVVIIVDNLRVCVPDSPLADLHRDCICEDYYKNGMTVYGKCENNPYNIAELGRYKTIFCNKNESNISGAVKRGDYCCYEAMTNCKVSLNELRFCFGRKTEWICEPIIKKGG